MKSLPKTQVTIPELGLIAGTRAILGAGIGLLLANRLDERQRKAVGWSLFAVGAVTTIPLLMQVIGGRRAVKAAEEPAADLAAAERPVDPTTH